MIKPYNTSKYQQHNKTHATQAKHIKAIKPMLYTINDQQHDEKLEQNEELAGLRAGVSLAKQTMSDQSKIHDFGRNFKKK